MTTIPKANPQAAPEPHSQSVESSPWQPRPEMARYWLLPAGVRDATLSLARGLVGEAGAPPDPRAARALLSKFDNATLQTKTWMVESLVVLPAVRGSGGDEVPNPDISAAALALVSLFNDVEQKRDAINAFGIAVEQAAHIVPRHLKEAGELRPATSADGRVMEVIRWKGGTDEDQMVVDLVKHLADETPELLRAALTAERASFGANGTFTRAAAAALPAGWGNSAAHNSLSLDHFKDMMAAVLRPGGTKPPAVAAPPLPSLLVGENLWQVADLAEKALEARNVADPAEFTAFFLRHLQSFDVRGKLKAEFAEALEQLGWSTPVPPGALSFWDRKKLDALTHALPQATVLDAQGNVSLGSLVELGESLLGDLRTANDHYERLELSLGMGDAITQKFMAGNGPDVRAARDEVDRLSKLLADTWALTRAVQKKVAPETWAAIAPELKRAVDGVDAHVNRSYYARAF